MKYLSVCSGIEAATVAWHPLGWSPVAFAEIEKFPSAVLAHHYPSIPNLGDMTKFKDWPDAYINVFVGGTPCQSFSIAGLRKGLADPRGNLALTYLAILDRYQPEWCIWENVPGVLSSGEGRDFGAFLGGLAELGYHGSYRVLDAQYVRVDGFARAVPQRRRRVFVVGNIGDWRRSAAVLFERESLLWNPPPRREAGQRVAPTISARTKGGGGLGTDFDCDGGLIPSTVALPPRAQHNDPHNDPHDVTKGTYVTSTAGVSHCLNAGGMGRIDYETETFVAHSLRAEGFDASEDGTGRGTPLVPIAFDCKASGQSGFGVGEIASTLRAMPMNSGKDFVVRETNVAQPIMAAGPSLGNQGGDLIAQAWAVRRLTPRECERLQGFPDDYTAIPKAADGPRYKALGNSMAVNAMRWLGRRIEMVSALSSQERQSP